MNFSPLTNEINHLAPFSPETPKSSSKFVRIFSRFFLFEETTMSSFTHSTICGSNLKYFNGLIIFAKT